MPQQYQGVLRHLLTFAGGYVVAKGAIIGLTWSWFSKKEV